MSRPRKGSGVVTGALVSHTMPSDGTAALVSPLLARHTISHGFGTKFATTASIAQTMGVDAAAIFQCKQVHGASIYEAPRTPRAAGTAEIGDANADAAIGDVSADALIARAPGI